MENLADKSWFTEHRGWEDFCSVLFGGLIVISPIIAETTTIVTVNAGICGVFIVGLALVEFMSLQRWEEVLELACGGWIMASPFVLQYGNDLRLIHLILGGGIVILALFELWQDRKRLIKN